MTDQQLDLQFTLDKKAYIKLKVKLNLKKPIYFILVGVWIVLLLALAKDLAFYGVDYLWNNPKKWVITLGILPAYFGYVYLRNYFVTKSQVSGHDHLDATQQMTISDEGITIVLPDSAQTTTVAWESMHHLETVEGWILVFTNKHSSIPIPPSAFTSVDDHQWLLNMAVTQHVKVESK